MSITNEGEERPGVLDEVQKILDRLHFAEPTLRQRIRSYLADAIDEEWCKCTLLSHVHTNGTQSYTASRLCIWCGTIHTLLVTINSSGDFDVAAPSPIGRDEY